MHLTTNKQWVSIYYYALGERRRIAWDIHSMGWTLLYWLGLLEGCNIKSVLAPKSINCKRIYRMMLLQVSLFLIEMRSSDTCPSPTQKKEDWRFIHATLMQHVVASPNLILLIILITSVSDSNYYILYETPMKLLFICLVEKMIDRDSREQRSSWMMVERWKHTNSTYLTCLVASPEISKEAFYSVLQKKAIIELYGKVAWDISNYDHKQLFDSTTH